MLHFSDSVFDVDYILRYKVLARLIRTLAVGEQLDVNRYATSEIVILESGQRGNFRFLVI